MVLFITADELLTQADNLSQQMTDLSTGKKHLKIGVTSMIGSTVLPLLLTDFHNQYPDVSLEIHELLTTNVLRNLENETLDVAIINSKSLRHHANPRFLEIIPLYDIEYMFCTYPDNPLAKNEYVTYDMLVNEPLVLLKSENVKDTIAISRFKEHGLTPSVLFYVNQIDTLKSFIHKKCASSFLFNQMVVFDKGLVAIPFKEKDISSPAIIFKKNHYISNIAAKFIEFTKNYV